MAKEEKIGHLLESAVLCQIGDPVTAIEETGFSLVHEAQRRFSRDHAFKAGTKGATIGMVPCFTCRRFAHCRTHTSSHVIREILDNGAGRTALRASSCDAANPAACRTASTPRASLRWSEAPSARQ